MNPTAIYSKSGKGVQEASGKTSILKRPDRAVLSAIDGRATLAEVAEKVGKPFDPAFEALITQLDQDGFVREVSPGAAPKGAAPAPGKAKPAASEGADLDFSAIIPSSPRPAPPPAPPKPAGPSAADLKAKADADKRAKEQSDALAKARQEAEARAQADRERLRKEAEDKIRAETEAKMRAEAETRMKADTDAKAKVLRAAAEAKVKAEAEAKKAREEADRARKEADEKADRARKEAEEKARREQEEMRKQLEAERKAREEAEKKAKEEAERARKEAEEKAKKEQEEMRRQLEEERKRIEAERKAREEEDRKRREQEEQEREARRKKEEEEAKERKRKREEEEARYRKEEEERVARRKREEEEEKKQQEERSRRQKEEEEQRARREKEETDTRARRIREDDEERSRKQSEATMLATPAVQPPPPPEQPAGSGTGGGFADSLLADLDSFGQREEEERKAKEETERKAREEKERKARDAEDKRRREEADRSRREAEDKRRREEEERERKDADERRKREEEERARAEAEERKRRARESMAKQQAESAPPARSADDDIGVTDDDLEMDDVKADEAKVSAESKRAKREREREKTEGERISTETVVKSKRPVKWGKPVALTLLVLLVAAVGAIHVMPVSVTEYENGASEALGQPVKLGSGRLSLFTGVRVKFDNVTVGGAKISTVRAYPDIGSLFGAKKSFSRIELEGLVLPQQAIGEAVFTKLKGDNFRVARITAEKMKLDGPLVLPALDADAAIGADGAVRSVTLRGADSLAAKITPKETEAEFEMTTGAFTVPFAPDVKFSAFGMKGTANRQGMNIAAWDGSALTGTLSGTANIRWGSTWVVDGVITARGINAGVFAPALLSEGRGEGTGKFSMNGEPAQLAGSSRIDANFTVTKGALSVFDLSRAIQTSGRQSSGRTPFAEMNGQATYDKGAVALRNVTMGAGALNAGISADIAETGALTGRIVADVKTATQTLRATFSLAGTVKEPQVRN